VAFIQVRREYNEIADRLVNEALDAAPRGSVTLQAVNVSGNCT